MKQLLQENTLTNNIVVLVTNSAGKGSKRPHFIHKEPGTFSHKMQTNSGENVQHPVSLAKKGSKP